MKKICEETDVAKRYFSISEAAKEIREEVHIVRFWLRTFDCFSPRTTWPRKLSGNDIEVLKIIKELLREELYLVKGVKRILKTEIKKRKLEHLQSRHHTVAA